MNSKESFTLFLVLALLFVSPVQGLYVLCYCDSSDVRLESDRNNACCSTEEETSDHPEISSTCCTTAPGQMEDPEAQTCANTPLQFVGTLVKSETRTGSNLKVSGTPLFIGFVQDAFVHLPEPEALASIDRFSPPPEPSNRLVVLLL